MKKRTLSILLSISIALSLSGCGTAYPDLTQEQYDQVTEYAAGLLMKYSYNKIERLANVSDSSDSSSEADTENSSESGMFYSGTASFAGSTDSMAVNGSTLGSSAALNASTGGSAGAGMQSSESTSSSDAASSQQGTTLAEQQENIQSMLGGLMLEYNGYSVMSDYPSEDAQGAVAADSGNKLLVLNFTVTNAGNQEVSVDMTKKRASFLISVNGKNQGYTLVSMLEDDLSTYQGKVASGDSKDVVLILQLPESTAQGIKTLGMTIKSGDESVSVSLE